jgi:hypothetical protein
MSKYHERRRENARLAGRKPSIKLLGEVMATDIYQKVESDFGEQASEVHSALTELDAKTKGLISPRLIRAIIYLANGDVARFHEKVKLAQTDWRDVLLQAEYSYPENHHVRDFNKTFYELGLLKGKST